MPLFFAMFKTLEGKTLEVELKNSLRLRGRLVSVDQYLNMKLDDIEVIDKANFPQLVRACPLPLARCAPRCMPPSGLPPSHAAAALLTRSPARRAALCALALCARRRGALRAAAVRGSGH
jgi:U6 snRNA-associated Sm-like protein LSm2